MLLYRWPILLASLCSLVLGFLSATLVTILGPSVKLLLDGDLSTPKSIIELFGQPIGEKILLLNPNLAFATGEQWMGWLPYALFAFAGCKSFFQFGSWYLWEWSAEGISSSLRKNIIASYLSLHPASRNEFQEEDLSTLVTTDCRLLREYIVHFYGGFPREALQILFMLATQWALSPKLTLIFLIGVLPIVFLINTLGRKIKRRANHALKDYSTLTEWLQQRLLGIETIKHYHTETTELKAMEEKSQNLFQKLAKASKTKAKTAPIIQFLAILCMIAALYVAFQDIAEGSLSGAQALSFFSSLALLAQSAGNCGRYFNSNRESAAALARVQKNMDVLKKYRITTTRPASSPQTNGNSLTCSNICVSYDGIKNVIQNFSFSFKPCRFYCLIGPSGSGKTTFFKAILGLLPLKSGSILFSDQVSLGYVPQQTDLLHGTFAEQIAYPNVSYDESQIFYALDLVGLLSFVKDLPKGIQTVLGDDGRDLSGGQKQRLALARIFYHGYNFLLIDEGSSALDPVSEKIFYESLKRHAQKATILFIAHKPKVLDYADEVLDFKAFSFSSDSTP